MPPKGKKGQATDKAKEEERDEPLQAVVQAAFRQLWGTLLKSYRYLQIPSRRASIPSHSSARGCVYSSVLHASAVADNC